MKNFSIYQKNQDNYKIIFKMNIIEVIGQSKNYQKKLPIQIELVKEQWINNKRRGRSMKKNYPKKYKINQMLYNTKSIKKVKHNRTPIVI